MEHFYVLGHTQSQPPKMDLSTNEVDYYILGSVRKGILSQRLDLNLLSQNEPTLTGSTRKLSLSLEKTEMWTLFNSQKIWPD